MGLLLCCLSLGDENASLVLTLHSGQWPETLSKPFCLSHLLVKNRKW